MLNYNATLFNPILNLSDRLNFIFLFENFSTFPIPTKLHNSKSWPSDKLYNWMPERSKYLVCIALA